MKTKTLQRAMQAAERFILMASKTVPATHRYCVAQPDEQEGGKDVAATKRASMDLTRALADLRGGK